MNPVEQVLFAMEEQFITSADSVMLIWAQVIMQAQVTASGISVPHDTRQTTLMVEFLAVAGAIIKKILGAIPVMSPTVVCTIIMLFVLIVGLRAEPGGVAIHTVAIQYMIAHQSLADKGFRFYHYFHLG